MKCEEFEAVGLGLDRESAATDIDPIELAAAIEHADTCARCAALQESWQEAQLELQALREATRNVGAPLRVEMRLRQEFWAKRRAMKARAAAVVGAWVLASAALLVVGMVWWNWHIAQENIPLQSVSSPAKNNLAESPSLAAPAGNQVPSNVPDNAGNRARERRNAGGGERRGRFHAAPRQHATGNWGCRRRARASAAWGSGRVGTARERRARGRVDPGGFVCRPGWTATGCPPAAVSNRRFRRIGMGRWRSQQAGSKSAAMHE